MTDTDLRFHLRNVMQTTERERETQLRLDEAETEYVSNPSKDEAVHDQLRDSVKAVRRVLRHDRLLAVAATQKANEYLNNTAD